MDIDIEVRDASLVVAFLCHAWVLIEASVPWTAPSSVWNPSSWR
jgi:hypothetical protein